MPAPRPESPAIRRLQTRIRRRKSGAEAAFWRRVSRSGTPIVEPVKGDRSHSWVTYLWHGSPRIRSVRMFGPQTEFGELDTLTRLRGTQVWYLTCKMRNDCLGGYLFLPNAPDSTEGDLALYLQRLKRGRLDPGNPAKFVSPQDPEFPDHPIYGLTYSVLQLPEAPNHRVLLPRPDSPSGRVRQYWLRSRVLKNRRRLWVYTPPPVYRRPGRERLVVFFDGFAYVNEIPAPTILDNLQADGKIPPTCAVFVDALDLETRGRELPGNPEFGRFLVNELLPWVRRIVGRRFSADRTVLGGFSYGGLCSMFWAMRRPDRFRGVISQSGSYWWSPPDTDEPVALAREFMRRKKQPLRIYMDAGRYEGSAAKENGVGQLGSNRHLRDVLRLKGYPVVYQTYTGGHDTFCWRQTLVEALPVVLS